MKRVTIAIAAAWALALAGCGSKHGAKGDAGGLDARSCTGTAPCVSAIAPAQGYVNGGTYVKLAGTGFAPGMKVFVGDGRAPVRVVSATEALFVTPPGPAGATDIKIDVAGTTATLPAAFTYGTAGLEMTWQQKPLMVVRGEDPGLAVMQDGRVLIAGGTTVPDDATNALATAEIYDRSTDTVTAVSSMMSSVRWHDAAVTLLTGKVLVVGGTCAGCAGDNGTMADLFDPATNTFTPTSHPLNKPRYYVRAVLLPDGRVFISSANDPSIEIYDPDTDQFTLIPHTQLHTFGFVVRLRDGRVLLGAGDGGVTAAEVFDFDADTNGPTAGPMVAARSMLVAATLPSGKVAIVGGASQSAGAIMDPLASIELYDPATSTFADAGYHLATPRTWHAGTLVRDGTILIMGGYTVSQQCGSSVASVEQIDPVAGTVSPFPMLLNTNPEWTAVTMLDGSVLGVGGGACGTTMALPDIDFLQGAIQ